MKEGLTQQWIGHGQEHLLKFLEEHNLELQPINTGIWDDQKTHVQQCQIHITGKTCNILMQKSLQIVLLMQQGNIHIPKLSLTSCFECKQHDVTEARFGFQK